MLFGILNDYDRVWIVNCVVFVIVALFITCFSIARGKKKGIVLSFFDTKVGVVFLFS